MFLAAFSSLPKLHPHLQTCVKRGESFLHNCATTRAFLAGVLRIHRHRNSFKYFSKVFNPNTELIPRCIVDRLSQAMILHHIFDSQINAQRLHRWMRLRTLLILQHGAMRLPGYFEMALA